jgi:hypothetical protein
LSLPAFHAILGAGETVNVARFAVESLIAAIGLLLTFLAYRHQGIRVATDRCRSYRKLWELMETARFSRLSAVEGLGPITQEDATDLYSAMGKWYYKDGNGMWTTGPTQALFFVARDDLAAYAVATGPDPESGYRCMREFSLLRTQMKSDIGVLGVDTHLSQEDADFLARAGIESDRPRYRRRFGLS